MSKVLITGGVGFIFSHVTQYMVSKGYDVVVIDNLSAGSHPEIIDGSFVFYKEDVSRKCVVDTIINEDPDYIIHAAAYSDVDGSIVNSSDVLHANNNATINVFEAARQCSSLKKLVYISTDEVYGECEQRKTEADIIWPKNPYSCSKAFGSLLRIAYDNTYSKLRDKTAETRFCNVIGQRQDPRKVLPRIREALLTGDPIPVHNGGGGYREYLWVDNIPPAVELVMLEGSRTYNITNNEGFTVNDLIKRVEAIVGRLVPITDGVRPGMDTKYQMDSTRIRELGWEPTVSFEEGLKKYLC